MKLFTKLLATATVATGMGLAFSAPASAYVVCNRTGDCWHTESRITAPGVTFSWHPDDYYFHQRWDNDRNRHWHNDYHTGRGYWRSGVWVTL